MKTALYLFWRVVCFFVPVLLVGLAVAACTSSGVLEFLGLAQEITPDTLPGNVADAAMGVLEGRVRELEAQAGGPFGLSLEAWAVILGIKASTHAASGGATLLKKVFGVGGAPATPATPA